MKTDYPVAIIGAGPYGLSLANHLTYNNTPFIILGKPMSLWKRHTFNSMNLRSDYATSEICHPTGQFGFERFCSDFRIPLNDIKGQLPVTVFRNYIDWCQSQFTFPISQQMVINLRKTNDGFFIKTDQNESFTAKKVVVATGIAHHLYIPNELKKHPSVVHGYHTRRIESIRKQNVLVVGAGQSAAESIAVLKENNNSVEWYTRRNPIYFSEPLNIPKWLFNQVIRLPRFIRILNPLLIQKLFALFSSTTVTPNFKSVLVTVFRHRTLPKLEQYDTVVAATGYRYNLGELSFIKQSLKSSIRQHNNYPMVSPSFETSVPGLFFLGAITEPFFGPPMKFMIGARYSSAVLARALYSVQYDS